MILYDFSSRSMAWCLLIFGFGMGTAGRPGSVSIGAGCYIVFGLYIDIRFVVPDMACI